MSPSDSPAPGTGRGLAWPSWLTPPQFPGDEERTRRARQIWVIALGSSVAVLFWALVSAIAVPSATARLLFTFPVLLGFGGILLLNRTGRIDLAGRSLVFGTWAGLTAILSMPGGVRETSFAWYLLVIFLASLLLGLRSALVVSAMSLGASLLLFWARQNGVLPAPLPATLGAVAAAELCIVLFLGVLLWVSDRSAAGLLGRLRSELDARLRAGAALEESERSMRALLDATTETAFLLDAEGRFVALNETLARAAGRPRSDFLGRSAFSMLPPDLAEARKKHVQRVLATGQADRFEDLGADGRWYDNHLLPVRSEGGPVVRVAVFARDITEQRESDAALRRYAERLAILHEIDGAILSSRSAFDIAAGALDGLLKLLPAATLDVVEIQADHQTVRVLADGPGEAGRSRRGETFPLYRLGSLEELRAGREAGASTRSGPSRAGDPLLVIPLTSRGSLIGALRILAVEDELAETHFQAVREVANHLAIALSHARLYEELARRARDLENAYGRLERLDKAKSDLLNVASHELRTPLSLVMGYGELLESHPAVTATSDLPRLVSGVQRGAERLKVILQDMLDVSAFQLGRKGLTVIEVRLSDVVGSVVSELAPAAAERQLRLHVLGMDELPGISGDPDALAKALRHLVLNAIKFTPDRGSITVEGRVVSNEAEAPAVDVVVEDTGIGINPQDQEVIFDAFFRLGETRLHSSGRTKFKGGGPGLGLALARRVVEAHGGRIWVESRGHDERACPGSRFVIRLPLASPSEKG